MEVRKPKNVYIIGAQSTGKTTIVRELQALFREDQAGDALKPSEMSEGISVAQSSSSATGAVVKKPAFITELARTVLQTQNVTRETMISKPDIALLVQRQILEAQHHAENDILSSESGAWFISDRSALDTVVYATEFAGTEAAETLFANPKWAELEERMKDSLVFVCEAGNQDWLVDDGIRYMPKDREHWEKIDRTFRIVLEKRVIRYSIIPRGITDRRGRASKVLQVLSKLDS